MSSFSVTLFVVISLWILGATVCAPSHRKMRTARKWSLLAAIGASAWALIWVAASVYGIPMSYDYGVHDLLAVAVCFAVLTIVTMVIEPPKHRREGRPVR